MNKNINSQSAQIRLTCEDNMALMARYADNSFDLTACEINDTYYKAACLFLEEQRRQLQLI